MVASSQQFGSRSQPPLPAGAGAEPLLRVSFHALGTRCEVQFTANSTEQATEFERAAVAWVQAFEAKYSRFRPNSMISRINAAAGRYWVEIDEDMEQMLGIGDALFAMTGGVLDPTALPLIWLWDYKSPKPTVPSVEQIAGALQLVGWRKLQRAPGKVFLPRLGMALDFGGFGKEYAVDIVSQIAVQHGITNVLVDFGHDIRALGAPAPRPCWHIGLEDPRKAGTYTGSIGVSGKGIASSGDYLRCFVINGRRYGHIVDPRTGWPVANGCTQATVVADTCLQAGILSTTAFVLGVSKGLEFIEGFPGADGLLVSDTSRAQTRGFFHYVVST
jgi:thiamine biosynthesis lipoprotein